MPFPYLCLKGAGHNDVEMYTQYLERLKQFVSVELVNWQQLHSDTNAQEAASGKTKTRTHHNGFHSLFFAVSKSKANNEHSEIYHFIFRYS